jgi:hypothetical protein
MEQQTIGLRGNCLFDFPSKPGKDLQTRMEFRRIPR